MGVDVIYFGYGFLLENLCFVECCEEEGIIFVGFKIYYLDIFGDKIKVKEVVVVVGIVLILGLDGLVVMVEEVVVFGEMYGFFIMIKVVLGGGGCGMCVVYDVKEVWEGYERVKSEVKVVFGFDEVYVEKYIFNFKYIEV